MLSYRRYSHGLSRKREPRDFIQVSGETLALPHGPSFRLPLGPGWYSFDRRGAHVGRKRARQET